MIERVPSEKDQEQEEEWDCAMETGFQVSAKVAGVVWLRAEDGDVESEASASLKEMQEARTFLGNKWTEWSSWKGCWKISKKNYYG